MKLYRLLGLTKSASGSATYYEWRDLFWFGAEKSWRKKRMWLSVNHGGFEARLEWSIGHHAWWMIGVDVGGHDNDQIKIFFGIWRLAVWLTVGGRLLRWIPNAEWWGGRETSIKLHDGFINLHLWYDEGITRPSGWHKMINVPDLVLGRERSFRETIDSSQAVVRLPEGNYPVTVTLYKVISWRPRWPRRQVAHKALVHSDSDIPCCAGKGDNDWDQDDQYINDMMLTTSSSEEAVMITERSIMEQRKRYGWPEAADNAD